MSANSLVSIPVQGAIQRSLGQKQGQASKTEQFLRLELSKQTKALLPIYQLSEVLKVPTDRVAPIPSMPAWVMGVYNWRGQILWIVDLANLLGLLPWHQQNTSSATHTVVVFNPLSSRTNNSSQQTQMLGLVVSKVTDLESCDPQLIQTASSNSSHGLAKFLRGYWMKSEDDVLAVLNGEKILAAMPKH